MSEPTAGLLDAVKIQIKDPDFIQQLAKEIGPHIADHLQTPDNCLSGKEVDEFFGIVPSTRYAWMKRGILKSYRVGGRTFYLRSDVMGTLTHKGRAGK